MKLFISIAIRLVLLPWIVHFAYMTSIGLVMGFDSGVTAFSSFLSIAYLFTFIPAIVVCLLPLKILTSPSLPLKIWYAWMILIILIKMSFTLYHFHTSEKQGEKSKYGRVCYILEGGAAEGGVMPNIDVQIPGGSFRRSIHAHSLAGGEWCGNMGLSLSPLRVSAYSATEENRTLFKARPKDKATPPRTIEIMPNETLCVYIRYLGQFDAEPDWSLQVEKCER